MFSVTYHDLATPKLRAMIEQLQPAQRRRMMARLGKELERQLKAHFTARDAEGNVQGFPSQHFWAREVRAKTALTEATSDRAIVGIDSPPFRMKLQGGEIRPGPGRRMLAIPMVAEAYGVLPRAGTIDGLFLLRAGGRLYLARREGKGFKNLRMYWRLVPKVNQKPDPRALPPLAQLQRTLEERADLELLRIQQSAGA